MNWLVRRITGLAEITAFCAMLGFCAGFLAKYHFLFDICTNFRITAIQGLLGCGVLLLIFAKKKWFGTFSLAAGIVLLFTLYPYYTGKPDHPDQVEKTRLLVFNVLTDNEEKAKVADYILSKDPDVIVLLEIDVRWRLAMMARLSQKYPWHIERTRADNFGIAAFSKRPFTSAEILDLGEEIPSVDLCFDNVRIIGTHPVPPMNRDYRESRNRQFEALERVVNQSTLPLIVCGDMNSTPWSPAMKNFMKSTGLIDSARGFGYRATWYGMHGLVGLWIDHVFHSKEITTLHRDVGPDLGSDHRAIVFDYQVN
ncbi:MAG: endonuclease/exonuclease/phosphatase family protein [Verrucomicrobiales bacterium]|nr:endonuclease/exonuclease/phosphatase family protein [Verrucomicrobiales bacterium]